MNATRLALGELRRFFPLALVLVVGAACGGGGGSQGVEPPSSLAYATSPAVYAAGEPIAPNAPASAGGTVSSYSVTPDLPPGLGLDSTTGIISGTPTAGAAEATYTITARNAGGSTTFPLVLTVEARWVAFVTSTIGDGNLGAWAAAGGHTGVAAADAICQAHASAAGLEGTFVAWLSDTTSDAYCRVHGLTGKRSSNCGEAALPATAGPWVRADGLPFSDRIDRMLSPTNAIFHPLVLDESGTVVNVSIHTGTLADGTTRSDATCEDWTSAASSSSGQIGIASYGSEGWGSYAPSTCDRRSSLACLETGVGGSLPAPPTGDKRAFITSAYGTGNFSTWPANSLAVTGVEGGDAVCQALAVGAGLPGTFKAWLSTATVNAADRLTANGPWARLDGTRIAISKADLVGGALLAPIIQNQQGVYVGQVGAWTGTSLDGTPGNTCSSWTSADGAVNGHAGMSAATIEATWRSAWDMTCDFPGNRLYCFED